MQYHEFVREGPTPSTKSNISLTLTLALPLALALALALPLTPIPPLHPQYNDMHQSRKLRETNLFFKTRHMEVEVSMNLFRNKTNGGRGINEPLSK